MKDNENNEVLKIVLIGEASVGKTSIIYQFIDKIFQEDLQSTIGGTFNSKSIKCNNNKTLNLEIWDTAGQERYRCVTKMFYKEADVAILVYDITSKSSFEELKNYWVEQVLEASPKNIMLVIVANKSDLIDNEQVDEEEARNYAKKVKADFFVISAKENNSVNELFKSIAKKYSGANSVEVIEENDDIMSFRKIRKESVRVTKAFVKKKKVGCC
jgi:small GTP-binding protein